MRTVVIAVTIWDEYMLPIKRLESKIYLEPLLSPKFPDDIRQAQVDDDKQAIKKQLETVMNEVIHNMKESEC